MKRFLFVGTIFVFVSSTIFAMEQEVKKETKQEEAKQKAEKPKTGFPQELTINETKDTLTSVNIENKDPLSLETFKEIIKEHENVPFIIARVTSMTSDEQLVASYYVPTFIHGHVYGNQPERPFSGKGYTRFRNAEQFGLKGPKSIQDPLTKGFIVGPIRYYLYSKPLWNDTFIYLASDYDLTEYSATDQINYPKKLLLEKIFEFYTFSILDSISHGRKKFREPGSSPLLFIIGSFFIYTHKFANASACFKQLLKIILQEKRLPRTSTIYIAKGAMIEGRTITIEQLQALINALEKENLEEINKIIMQTTQKPLPVPPPLP